MSNYVVIVESPAKAKTISKYLGKEYRVLASYGHVRDLPAKKGSVDPDNNFHMTYNPIEKNLKHVNKIAESVKESSALYLATDPDREGEAISWHIYELLKEKKALVKKEVHRVVFHEITKTAIKNAIESPRAISMDLVNAQQARRALDYLVGFNLSPLLWKKVQRGLSAGRVQSPALRMIVEREEEIEQFKAREYWSIEADLTHKKINFIAKLFLYQNQKVEQFTITNEKDATRITNDLSQKANGLLVVQKVEKKERKRNPTAPFTTSTLQQEAVRKLGFSAQKTMRIAQQLYEGIETDQGPLGLITYMRTDSVQLANEAIEDIRQTIQQQFGENFLPSAPVVYKTKSKNAQEAHEAIRPTHAHFLPKDIKTSLTPDQFKLYELIWKRTIACQMIPATIHSVVVELGCGDGNAFKATGSSILNPGFMQVYQEDKDDHQPDTEDSRLLPELNKGDKVNLTKIHPEQHFTEPPPRYSEASLVKTLEEYGIGRPSTYASIISTLLHRGYVNLDKKRFIPTDIGRIVNRFLTQHFNKYVDYGFTANLEDDLDAISRGEKNWIPLLKEFWTPFKDQVTDIEQHVKRSDVTSEVLDENCPKCQKPVAIRLGKRGRFIGCTGYPDCDYTRSLNETEVTADVTETIKDRHCPKCDGELLIKAGRYGKFIGCSNYPTCKYMEPLEKPKDTGVVCPECKKADLVERRSRYGKIFYSCQSYPTCKYAVWNQPMNETCPKCNWPILTLKTTKRRGTEKVCPQKECGYTLKIEEA